MSKIEIRSVTTDELKRLHVENWPVWECQPSTFDWEYDLDETAYVLEGHVEILTSDGVFELRGGDLALFPKGLSCTWKVRERIRKVYRFE